MKSFLVFFSIIALVILKVDADTDDHYVAVFKSRQHCHPGHTGITGKIIDDARMKCKYTATKADNCFKACLYDKLGMYHTDGHYQEARLNEIVDTMFRDGAKNPIAQKWHRETKDCAMKYKAEHIGHFPKNYMADDCPTFNNFDVCVGLSRDCPK